MQHFRANDGTKIHVAISGDGPPLIMLHGWTSSHREWFPFIPALEKHYTIYRWDARGHGGHPLPEGTVSNIKLMAQDLHRMILHFGLCKPAAVGHSMGALTLWQHIQDFGNQTFSKLCFIDQSPKLLTDDTWAHGIYGNFNQEKAYEFRTWLEADFAEAVLKLTALGLNQRAKEKYFAAAEGWEKARKNLKAQAPRALIDCWESLTAADYRETLSIIETPSLLIFGSESNFYNAEAAAYVAKSIRGSKLKIYPGTDHSPHQWKREAFTEDLLDFLSKPAANLD